MTEIICVTINPQTPGKLTRLPWKASHTDLNRAGLRIPNGPSEQM